MCREHDVLVSAFDFDYTEDIYMSMYLDRPALVTQLKDLWQKIAQLQTEQVPIAKISTAKLDHNALLKDYDISAIDASPIKYYQAVQHWIDELLNKLDEYEREAKDDIFAAHTLCQRIAGNYEPHERLTAEENALLADRQKFSRQEFSLDLAAAKMKLLSVRKQADAIESRLEEIDASEDSLRRLAELHSEPRPPFALVAENTAKIVKAALRRIAFFQAHRSFVAHAVQLSEAWAEDYCIFKTAHRDDFQADCKADSIEAELYEKWYGEWRDLRFAIEAKIQPLLTYALRSDLSASDGEQGSVAERLLTVLDTYKNAIDKFFQEERKGIYQKFAFSAGGDLQEKFETESELYKRTAAFQTALQDIVFSCEKSADRIFILQWADSLLQGQIDGILQFVEGNDLRATSKEVLAEFTALKQERYEDYSMDVATYAAAQAQRDKEYNSLIFKMRKDLMKA